MAGWWGAKRWGDSPGGVEAAGFGGAWDIAGGGRGGGDARRWGDSPGGVEAAGFGGAWNIAGRGAVGVS